jgi:hypothetical protein
MKNLLLGMSLFSLLFTVGCEDDSSSHPTVKSSENKDIPSNKFFMTLFPLTIMINTYFTKTPTYIDTKNWYWLDKNYMGKQKRGSIAPFLFYLKHRRVYFIRINFLTAVNRSP